MSIRYIDELDIEGRRLFVRVDYNVPLDEERRITDDTRIRASLPTLRYALERKAALVLASHLGRPKGKVRPELSLLPVAERLSELLDREVVMAPDCVSDGVSKVVSELTPGAILMLENLRFHPEEEANDPRFAGQLAKHGEIYLTDAFGTLHRAHASTCGMISFFEEKGAGFLIRRELHYLRDTLSKPKRPFVAILGGAKVSDKFEVIDKLLERVDHLLIGGAMAYTFLLAEGIGVGRSLVEERHRYLATRLLEKAKGRGVELLLPIDHIVAEGPEGEAVPLEGEEIPETMMALDIGPATLEAFRKRIASARTIFWNGPMGLFEKASFAEGTFGIARALAEATTASRAVTIVGGGDSVAALQRSGVSEQITHISTGGGASLEFIEGKQLPGLEALESSSNR